MKAKYYYIALFNFFIAALLGLLLRFIQIWPLADINYTYILHGHSHVAMLGWIYLFLYLILIDCFGSDSDLDNKFYSRLFWITQISVVGMMFTFPFQGYAAASITFSTLHIFCSYAFTYKIWKNNTIKSKEYNLLLKTALSFMVLSTVGVWCLGPAVGLMGKSSAFYQIAIQFFLHFQFNGWFLIATIALLLYFYNKSILIKNFNCKLTILIVSIILTLSLPVNWYLKTNFLYWLNVLGTIMQACIFIILAKDISKNFCQFWKQQKFIEKILLTFVLASLFTKIFLQLSTILPQMIDSIHHIRNWIIGFIHLNMIGFMSSLFFWILIKKEIISINNKVSTFGFYVFLITYVITELLLLTQGLLLFFGKLLLPNYFYTIFFVSIGLPIGILAILISPLNSSRKLEKKI